MKKLKQISILCFFTLLLVSCSNSDSPNNSSEPTLQGRWAFGEDLGCGRNSIEFKNTNVFIEHHYNSNCSSTPYYGEYSHSGDIVIINGTDKIIVELTATTLILFNPDNDVTSNYDRVN